MDFSPALLKTLISQMPSASKIHKLVAAGAVSPNLPSEMKSLLAQLQPLLDALSTFDADKPEAWAKDITAKFPDIQNAVAALNSQEMHVQFEKSRKEVMTTPTPGMYPETLSAAGLEAWRHATLTKAQMAELEAAPLTDSQRARLTAAGVSPKTIERIAKSRASLAEVASLRARQLSDEQYAKYHAQLQASGAQSVTPKHHLDTLLPLGAELVQHFKQLAGYLSTAKEDTHAT